MLGIIVIYFYFKIELHQNPLIPNIGNSTPIFLYVLWIFVKWINGNDF